jgi:hypothetical protein
VCNFSDATAAVGVSGSAVVLATTADGVALDDGTLHLPSFAGALIS